MWDQRFCSQLLSLPKQKGDILVYPVVFEVFFLEKFLGSTENSSWKSRTPLEKKWIIKPSTFITSDDK